MVFLRTDTVEKDDKSIIINPSYQQCIGVVGRRGKKKSYTLQALAILLHLEGHTIADLWGTENMENGFYCIKDKIQIPITILAQEGTSWNDVAMKIYNGKMYSKEEWRKKGYLEYDPKDPELQKPLSKQGQEWIRVVILPTPTMTEGTDINNKMVDTFINALLDCREQRRILVFNPMMFPDEKLMFRIQEIIIRSLRIIRQKHFRQLSEKVLGIPYKTWTKVQKNWDKLTLVFREFGELCPAKLKGDKSGLSTLVKKAMLQFMRKARHYMVSVLADWQKFRDVEDAVRSQFDIIIIKKWTRGLASDENEWMFKFIKFRRDGILYKGDPTRKPTLFDIAKADSLFPKIEELGENYMYVQYGDDLELWDVPICLTKHKLPQDNFDEYTGITFTNELVELGHSATMTTKVSEMDEKLFVSTVYMWKNKDGKKKSNQQMLDELAIMQQDEKLTWDSQFKDMKPNTFSKRFSTLSKKYRLTDAITVKSS